MTDLIHPCTEITLINVIDEDDRLNGNLNFWCFFILFLVAQFNSDESQLRAMLLEGYVPEARPVINTTTVTIVDIGLMIVQVMDLVGIK